MRNKIMLFLVVVSIVGFNKTSYAMSCHDEGGNGAHMQMTQAESSEHGSLGHSAVVSSQAVNVGNKICPVTGEKIDEKNKVTYEYKGKIYNFCCAGCPEEFKKDPEKYIKKVEQELQAGSKGQAAHEGHEMGNM